MERRLAAILAADVVSHSRLIREDEAGTLAALKAHRERLIEPKVAERNGRIVNLMGDGALRDFYPCPDPDRKSGSVEVMNRLGCPPSLRS